MHERHEPEPRWRVALQMAGLVALAAAVFAPALRCGYIWDDDDYVTRNITLESPGGLARIWFEPVSTPQYYPLVFTTFWIERRLWGLEPAGYHAVNVLLHGLAAAAFFAVLRRLRVPFAWLAAAAFAIHPVQAESVVWITERKNVLSGLFYFLALAAWLRHALERDESDARRGGAYGCALVLFLLALLSKTTASTLPATIAVLLIWRRGRISRNDAIDLAPMFALGLAMGLHTAWLEKHSVGAAGREWEMSLLDRFHVAGRAPIFYAAKVLFPQPLCFIYERWSTGGPPAGRIAPGILLLGVLALALAARRRTGAPLAALACFLVALAPALGFFDVYPFVYSFVADHFQYLATAPILALVVPGLGGIATRRSKVLAPLGLAALLLWLAALAAGSMAATAHYRDAETLWRENLRKRPRGVIGHINLGSMFMESGNLDAAIEILAEGARAAPDSDEVLSTLGGALVQAGRVDEGLAALERARAINPARLSMKNNFALAALAQGRPEDAERISREVISQAPDEIMAYNNLAAACFRTGRVDEAVQVLRDGLRRDPGNVMLRGNLEQIESRADSTR